MSNTTIQGIVLNPKIIVAVDTDMADAAGVAQDVVEAVKGVEELILQITNARLTLASSHQERMILKCAP